jgi:hypothetical protein
MCLKWLCIKTFTVIQLLLTRTLFLLEHWDKIIIDWVKCPSAYWLWLSQYRWGNLSENDQLEDQGVDGRKILKWIIRKWDVGV